MIPAKWAGLPVRKFEGVSLTSHQVTILPWLSFCWGQSLWGWSERPREQELR